MLGYPVLADRRPGDGTNIGAAARGGADYRLQQLGRGGPAVPFPEAVLREILEARVTSSRGELKPRGVKRKMSNYPLRRVRIEFEKCSKIIK